MIFIEFFDLNHQKVLTKIVISMGEVESQLVHILCQNMNIIELGELFQILYYNTL